MYVLPGPFSAKAPLNRDNEKKRKHRKQRLARTKKIKIRVGTHFLLLTAFIHAVSSNKRGKFLLAADMSYLPMLDCYGKCSPFRLEASGPTEDALKILAQSGLNTVRLRLWVNPSEHTPQGWPTDDYSYANLTSVLALVRRLRDAHLDLWLSSRLFSKRPIKPLKKPETPKIKAGSVVRFPLQRWMVRSKAADKACALEQVVSFSSSTCDL